MKRSRTFRKKAGVALLILLMIGIGLQFIRPPLENPSVTGDIQAPPEVKAIFRRACEGITTSIPINLPEFQ